MDTPMKKFAITSIKQVAKYIKIFFAGTMEVVGLGIFNFTQGRLCSPEDASEEQVGFVREVNQLIKVNQPQANWIN